MRTKPDFERPSADSSGRLNRRTLLKGLTAAVAAAALPDPFSSFAQDARKTLKEGRNVPTSALAKNPRWYGFNLLEYFSTDPDWMRYFPYKNNGMFLEDDFRWIRDWGFN